MADTSRYPKITAAPDWSEVFKRRPDLEPPGYHETVRKILEGRQLKEC